MAFRIVLLICLLVFVWNTEGNTLARVAGGNHVSVGQYPYQVSLQSSWTPSHFCGGSILSPYWILTAAHCVNLVKGSIIVKAGKHDIFVTETTEQAIPVTFVFSHKKYLKPFDPSDIALLKLSKPLQYNQYVQPISLPARNTEYLGYATVTGWGFVSTTNWLIMYPRYLQVAQLRLVDTYTCNKQYKTYQNNLKILSEQICTVSAAGLCPTGGDSGGPLMVNINGTMQIIGVVSWGTKPCVHNYPAVYTKVSSFIDWIERIMSRN